MFFCKNPDAEVPILEMYDQIGVTKDEYGFETGISGQAFADQIKFIEGQPGKKGIDIYINSVGGSIIEGMTIIAAIKSCKLPVNTVCVGVAISMAGVILQVGKVRKMVKEGIMMIHPPQGDEEKVLKTFKAALLQFLTPRTDLTEDEMEDLMMRETWLTAQECLELKLIDEIVDITSIANAPEAKKIENRASRLKKIVNELKPKPEPKNPNTMEINKIKNTLNLNGDATENQVQDALKDLVNSERKAKKAVTDALKEARKIQNKKDEDEDEDEDTYNALKKEMKALKERAKKNEDEIADLRAKLSKKETEADDLKNQVADLQNAGTKAEAEAFIGKAVEDGKIIADVKDTFVEMYLADKDKTVALVNGIKAVKQGPGKLPITNSKDPKASGAPVTNKSNNVDSNGSFLGKWKNKRIAEYEKNKK